MKILVTGSSGQIGTNLSLRLLDDGHTVYGVDKRPNNWTDRIPTRLLDVSMNYEAFSICMQGLEDVDMVVHFAADAKVHDLVKEPHRAMKNITVTYNVLEFCRQNKLPIVFSSSREVYGDIHRYITDESSADFAFTESPYSASKIAGEALIYSYAQCYGIKYLVFRFSNVYGRYDNDIQRMERVIPKFIYKISRNEPITVYGEKKVLDFTYVDDCVDGVWRGIDRLAKGAVSNETINLAFGEGNSLVNMAEFIGDALGIKPDMTIEPSQVGEVTHYVADITKAREMLGYNPSTSLQEGIRKTVEWAVAWWEQHGDGGYSG